MKMNPFKSISASYMRVEKILMIFLTIFVLNACSGNIEIGIGRKDQQAGSSSNVTLVNIAGLVDRILTFDSSDETNFIDYTFNCAYKATSNGPETPCVNYGTNTPSIDPMSVHFLWDIDSATPNGFYSFTIHKNYTDKTLTQSFVLQVNFKAPFIAKFQLNPDLLLTINVDDSYAYDFFIDWGDGSAIEHKTSGTSFSHQYAGPATTATVTITGDLPAFKVSAIAPTDRAGMIAQAATYLGMDIPTVDAMLASYSTSDLYVLLQNAGVPLSLPAFNSKVTEITQFGSLGLKKMDDLFQGQGLLTFVGPGDLSTVESMENAFKAIGNNTLPVTFDTTGWGLENVVNVSAAFSSIIIDNATDFSGIIFSNKLKNASYIFYGSRASTITSVASWNLSGVTNFKDAFTFANFTNLDTTNWNMQNVVNFQSSFSEFDCTSCDFTGIHVTNKATNVTNMFDNYDGPSPLTFGSFDISEVQNSSGMFRDLDFNLFSHSNAVIVTDKNTNLSFMFNRTQNLILDTSNWNTSNVENFEEMFKSPFMTGSLGGVDMSGVIVSNKATNLKGMFANAIDLILDTSAWNTSSVANFSDMFRGVNMINVNTSGVRVGTAATDLTGMFSSARNLSLNTNLLGKEWNTSNVTDMSFLFDYAACLNISACDFSRVIPTAQTTTMVNTFSGLNHQLIDGLQGTSWIDDSNFPAIDTSAWNTTNVTNFAGIFARKNMAGSNLSGLSVTNKAENLGRMFDGSSNLTLDTTSWDMTNVTYANDIFSEMDASGINFAGFIPQGNISLENAFDGVKNAVIKTSNWNLSSGANIQLMFFNLYNTKLHIDLNLANLLNATNAFNSYGPVHDVYVLIEAGTTDPGLPTGGASYLDNTNVWCPNYAGTEFMGVTCQKAPFPYP